MMMFKEHEKELNKKGYFFTADQIVNERGDVVASMNPYGEFDCKDNDLMVAICNCERAEAEAAEKKPVKKVEVKKKKRARDEDGHFKADDPSTPDVNEAWEEDK